MTETVELTPVARNTVVDTVAEQIRSQILSGAFVPGARLPPERDLAEKLGINRLTLRAALARLEALGLVTAHHGTGTIVRDYRLHGGIDALGDLLRLTRTNDPGAYRTLVRDLLEVRRTMVAEAVALAAERHTADDLVALESAATAQRDRTDDTLAFAAGDLAFARLVVRSSRNLGLELLLNTTARVPEQDPELIRAMYPKPRVQCEHYTVVLGLIAARDPVLARDTMRAALEEIDRLTLNRIARAVRAGAPPSSTSTTMRRTPSRARTTETP